MRVMAHAIAISWCLWKGFAVAVGSEPNACQASRAQLDANKELVMEFFSFEGSAQMKAARFLTEDYIQHNPRLLRMDAVTGASGREAWLQALVESERRGIAVVELAGFRLEAPVILMAECDLVTAVYEGTLEDPEQPNHTYEAFAFETFRIRNGKLAEHWDAVKLDKSWVRQLHLRGGGRGQK